MHRWLTMILVLTLATPLHARTHLKNICRVKGQEENELRGLGLVVGLNGTGEVGDGPTMRAMARAMEIMGSPLSFSGAQGQRSLEELKKMKNASLVMVTATIPATGARRGDKIDCYVSAINGKSIEGGRLAFASLQGPNTTDPRVYGLCQGQIVVENPEQPMVGVIHKGCQMEADVFTKFYTEDDWKITLVLDEYHADFETANIIAENIEERFASQADRTVSRRAGDTSMVHARDAANIEIKIPEAYRSDPVEFISHVLSTQVYQHEPEARVTINSRAGSIVISGDVEIGDVAITHRNSIAVEATAAPSFQGLSTDDRNLPKLKDLLAQLDALKVSTDDMIEIIRGIEQAGKLHGRLVIE